MDAVDKWMGKHHLPKSLRTRIGHHYQEVAPVSHFHACLCYLIVCCPIPVPTGMT